MADPINLNRARKAKARAELEVQAAANRAAFGRSKAAKTLIKAEQDRQAGVLDATRRDG